MSNQNLSDVGTRLEETVKQISKGIESQEELADLYEDIAISVLDSEHGCYPPEMLQAYLCGYLDSLRARS